MSSMTFRSSRPDSWTMPRPYRDESLRRFAHGPIQPMEEPSTFSVFLSRLFGSN